MAGFWHLSHHQLRDLNGRAYAGARAFFYEAASLNPITVYQDYGLGTPHPNPVQANAHGIFPPVFLDEEDGFYRQRITTTDGVIIDGLDVGILPIIGPSGGGGVEVPVDENALAGTGDVKWRASTGSLAGWVRLNNRTIGSATSGASERANADVEALFLYLHGNFPDSLAPVSGGRGASAAADWAANKTLGLFDLRGKAPFGLPDMGNTDSGLIPSGYIVAGSRTVGGSFGGDDEVVIGQPNLPSVNFAVTIPSQWTHNHTFNGGTAANVGSSSTSITPPGNTSIPANSYSALMDSVVMPQLTGTAASGGSATALNKMPPFILGTWYIRL